jgi:hypothetical protein
MAMKSETLSLVITGDGKQLGSELVRQENRVRAFGSKVGSMMAGVGKRIGGAVGKIAGNPLALLGGTAGVIMAARDLAEYQDKLSTVGIKAGLSAAEMMKFEQQITSASYKTGQGRDALLGAVDALADIASADFAAESLEAVGKAATATSADVAEVAAAFATFNRDMGATGEEAAQLFNTMAALDNIHSMDRFAKSAQVLGLTKDNFAGYNALIKTLAPTFGNSADAAAQAIDQIGIALKTNKSGELAYRFRGALDKDGTIKDYGELLKVMASMQDRTRKAVFAKAGANMTGFDVDKVTADFDEYMKKAGDATHVSDAFARKQGEAKYQMNALAAAGKEFAALALGPAMQTIAARIGEITGDPTQMNRLREGLSGIAEALSAVATAASYAGNAYGVLRKVFDWSLPGLALGAAGHIAGSRGTISQRDLDRRNKELRASRARGAETSSAASSLNALPAPAATAPEVKNAIAVNIQVAPDGRVITQVDGKNTTAAVTADRGTFR